MKTFRLLFLFAFLTGLFSLPVSLSAAEASYSGDLKGIDCTACKQKIARALGKIKGVKTIRIVKKSGEKHSLQVMTDGSVNLTKGMVVNAIADAEHYKVTNWRSTGS